MVLLAACGGDDAVPNLVPTPGLDASQISSADVRIGVSAVLEKQGRFGPDLGFVIRLPEQWNGRSLVAIPGAGASALDLDEFGDDRVNEGTVYASIDSTAVLDAPLIYLAYLGFVREQIVAQYGRVADETFLFGVERGGWQVQQMIEGDRPVVDGALLVSPWGRGDVVRDYPALVRALTQLAPAFPKLAGGSLATLTAAELQLVRELFDLGLPPGTEAAWSANVDFWAAAAAAGIAAVDPAFGGGAAAVPAYDLAARPLAAQDAVEAATPAGRLTARSVLLQGGEDMAALPLWSQRYVERTEAQERGAGIVRYVFEGADHDLAVPGESDDFRRARLLRAWQTLLGWVLDDVPPGPVLGATPQQR